MPNLAGSHVAKQVDQFVGDGHRRASLVAVEKKHQGAVAARDLSQRGSIAERQTSRRRGIQRIDAAQELLLRRRELHPIAAVTGDNAFWHIDSRAFGIFSKCGGR